MDISSYRVSLNRHEGWPFVTLAVMLHCRPCEVEVEASGRIALQPHNLAPSVPFWVGKGYGEDPSKPWNTWISKKVLAMPRYCRHCGDGSIIPDLQVDRLIAATDTFQDWEWLEQAAKKLGFSVGSKPTVGVTAPGVPRGQEKPIFVLEDEDAPDMIPYTSWGTLS